MDILTFISDLQRRADLARETGSSPDYLWQIATGRRRASPELARNIDEATTRLGPDRVSKESLRPDIWQVSSGNLAA